MDDESFGLEVQFQQVGQSVFGTLLVNALLTQQQGRILGFSNQKIFPHAKTVSPNKHEIPIRNKEPDGYQLR